MKIKHRYGLIGKNISYSFSKGHFTQKFKEQGLVDHAYDNFDLPNLDTLEQVFKTPALRGVNVTIPYKEQVIPYLEELDEDAATIGAVNTIKIGKNGLKGYNTDAYGFQESLKPLLQPHHQQALILGTGGASKAVAFVLKRLNIHCVYVSRTAAQGRFTYDALTATQIEKFTIIINCSPVGTHPNVLEKPLLPYQGINANHLLYDLIYNPAETAFLAEGRKRGGITQNGLPMLQLQAEKAWEIWNS
ncbi:MAG: shikimate dehydrogenase [Bacteroidota bacterium]